MAAAGRMVLKRVIGSSSGRAWPVGLVAACFGSVRDQHVLPEPFRPRPSSSVKVGNAAWFHVRPSRGVLVGRRRIDDQRRYAARLRVLWLAPRVLERPSLSGSLYVVPAGRLGFPGFPRRSFPRAASPEPAGTPTSTPATSASPIAPAPGGGETPASATVNRHVLNTPASAGLMWRSFCAGFVPPGPAPPYFPGVPFGGAPRRTGARHSSFAGVRPASRSAASSARAEPCGFMSATSPVATGRAGWRLIFLRDAKIVSRFFKKKKKSSSVWPPPPGFASFMLGFSASGSPAVHGMLSGDGLDGLRRSKSGGRRRPASSMGGGVQYLGAGLNRLRPRRPCLETGGQLGAPGRGAWCPSARSAAPHA